MQKTALVILVLILGITTARPTSPQIAANITWDIAATGVASVFDVEVVIPSNTSNQQVLSMEVSEPFQLSMNGTDWKAKFHFANFSGTKRITGRFLVATDYIDRKKTEDSPTAYLSGTKLVVITDEMKSLVQSFPSSFPSNVFRILDWIHENVIYDANYIGPEGKNVSEVSMPSDWVMQNKVGVCDEFTHLFVALARADVIPTRVAGGYVFINDSWVPHTWAEVYSQQSGWIEVDPTWGEFLNLDAARIRIGTGVDQSEITDKVSALVGRNTNISINHSIQLALLQKTEEEALSLNVTFPGEENFSTLQPVEVTVENKVEEPVFSSFFLVPPSEVYASCERKILLAPLSSVMVNCTLSLQGSIRM